MSVEYQLEGSAVMRVEDGEAVEMADFTDNVLTIPLENKRYQRAIMRQLNALDQKVEQVNILGEEPAPEPTVTVTASPSAPVSAIPAKPLPRRAMGDKTPEIVHWYHDHHFDQFKSIYGVKSDEKGPDGKYVANRETCLTRKIQTGDGGTLYAD